ncbi:PKD domain-containing protein [Candidatus Acetothermia bacterium]|nr:PKD domain-containing protein [Candidatus Acetothermia bacterium]
MKNSVKFLFVLGLAVVAGALSLLPSQGQVGNEGSPPGVIVKNPAESPELAIAVSMRQGAYIRNATAAEFVHFTLRTLPQQSAFMYLYDVAVKTGEVRLLFPNRAVQKNFLPSGEYAFPEDFMKGFPIENDGLHFVQAIATQRPLDLSLGLEQFRLLGTEPEIVRLGIETLIRDQGLTRSQWTADWTRYSVVPLKPTSGNEVNLIVSVIDSAGNEIPGAQFYLEDLSNNTKVNDWTYLSIATPPKTLILNTGIRYRLKARADRFKTQLDCKLQSSPGLKQPCDFSLSSSDKVNFLLEPLPPPFAHFKVDNPGCAGTPVQFDASGSVPRSEITKYVWDFGDPTAPPVEVIPPDPLKTHTYYNVGTYPVKLTVFFKDGQNPDKQVPALDQQVEVIPAGESDCLQRPPVRTPPIEDGDGKVITQGNVVALRAKKQGVATLPSLPDPPVKAPDTGNQVQVSLKYDFTQLPRQEDMGPNKVNAQAAAVLRIVDTRTKRYTTRVVCKVLETGQRPDTDTPFICSKSISLDNLMNQLGITRNLLRVELGVELNVSSAIDSDFVNVRFILDQNTLTSGSSSTCASVNTQQAYSKGAPVGITFHNGCNRAIQFPNSAPWLIKNSSQVVVYVPPQTPTPIFVEREQQYVWDQKDNSGKQVEPKGNNGEQFTIEFTTIGPDGKSELHFATFTIK